MLDTNTTIANNGCLQISPKADMSVETSDYGLYASTNANNNVNGTELFAIEDYKNQDHLQKKQPVDEAVGTNIGLPLGNNMAEVAPSNFPTECARGDMAKKNQKTSSYILSDIETASTNNNCFQLLPHPLNLANANAYGNGIEQLSLRGYTNEYQPHKHEPIHEPIGTNNGLSIGNNKPKVALRMRHIRKKLARVKEPTAKKTKKERGQSNLKRPPNAFFMFMVVCAFIQPLILDTIATRSCHGIQMCESDSDSEPLNKQTAPKSNKASIECHVICIKALRFAKIIQDKKSIPKIKERDIGKISARIKKRVDGSVSGGWKMKRIRLTSIKLLMRGRGTLRVIVLRNRKRAFGYKRYALLNSFSKHVFQTPLAALDRDRRLGENRMSYRVELNTIKDNLLLFVFQTLWKSLNFAFVYADFYYDNGLKTFFPLSIRPLYLTGAPSKDISIMEMIKWKRKHIMFHMKGRNKGKERVLKADA
ncbi:hypothetical protein Tco_0792200 [Tanacetum coccineum]